jgi:ubiquinone/menaquinone biosynthesis C-methylase UbiE
MPLYCPACRAALDMEDESARCQQCARCFKKKQGVWRLLHPGRSARIEEFLADYTRVRLAEGRGSDDPAFYRQLPRCPDNHPIAWQWSIKRRTFQCLRTRVLPSDGASLLVLDVGAGTGWLSHQLALLGHRPCALDVSVDDQDGLQAARHFEPSWPRIQAEFDFLPLADASMDLIIFNASLHYSTDYVVSLRESLRVLRPGGRVVILETPVYRHEASGRQMVAVRRAQFLQRFGTRSDSMASEEYLTWARVEMLSSALALNTVTRWPRYGVRWALRPWLARLRRAREPSRFPILIARRAAA